MEAKRERYTPNDVGPIPNDWSAPKLSDVSTLITNGFVGTASPHYTDSSGIPYLFGKNVRPNRIDPEGIRYITNSFHEKQSKTKLETGDLLTVQSGHIGETAVVPSTLSGANCHALIVTRLLKERVLPMFMSYYLNSEIGRARMAGLEVGSTILHINTKDLKKFRVIVPPVGEQKKIAQILSTWDKAITTTERLLANSQQQKKALMQQLLTGKKRLLDENGVGFGGKWNNSSLKDLIKVNKGKQINRNTLSKTGEFPVINGGVEPSGYTCEFNTEANTITISEGGNSCGHIGFQTNKFWCGGHCYAVRDSKLELAFTYHLLKFNQNRIMRLRVGSGLPNIQRKDLESLSVWFPTAPEEQQSISNILNKAEQETAYLEQKLIVLNDEKKALMQQLLTGKRRVKVDEEAA
ncbi:restriction endonuclease subunit S [Idiomarina abyssalis]|uniref:restriction endonuclease subunit S n=1 Tax=Idiomarina abyssalis TaxID=86102 RepID=UPI001CD38FB3|nr:restriction endonuclease subunit S [Idiomarina abyssalis]